MGKKKVKKMVCAVVKVKNKEIEKMEGSDIVAQTKQKR